MLFLIFAVIYILLLALLYSQWKISAPLPNKFYEPVSLIIPFRNEEVNLPRILDSIRHASPDEVIFCNDHSDDDSVKVVQGYIIDHDLGHWKLIDSRGIGKKAALTTAVHYSYHDIILTTDADCIVPANWVKHIIAGFNDPQVNMVCGGVSVTEGHTLIEIFQKAEWASIALVTQFFFKIYKPLTCSAANMAYRKSAFMNVGGYKENEDVSSGDDEFLLKKISSTFGPKSVVFLNNPEIQVKTFPTPNLSSYITQRARWAGKWKAHKEWSHASTALFFFAIAILQLSSFTLLLGSREDLLCFFIFWIAKSGAEYLVLGKVLQNYHKKISIFPMIMVSILQPISVIVIGIFSNFVKNSWKGRLVLTKA